MVAFSWSRITYTICARRRDEIWWEKCRYCEYCTKGQPKDGETTRIGIHLSCRGRSELVALFRYWKSVNCRSKTADTKFL